MTNEMTEILDFDGFNRNKSYLYLDDIDKDFEGKQDEYWFYPKCTSSMKVLVRYNKIYGITYQKDENI